MQRLYAVRGAVTVESDTREQVVERTQTLLKELFARNRIDAAGVVSMFFTATDDIHAEFPAAAARLMGLNGIPLLCSRELEIHSSLAMPRCIRVLVHYYGDAKPEPVYLGETTRLLDPPDPA
ncbi:MAG TPA: chorismate mutase [Actinomycetota bacterium]|jgi:chorismate mutase|nr:chorismate mutase [Actinomycetota bacterium]